MSGSSRQARVAGSRQPHVGGSRRAQVGGSYPALLGLLALMWGSSYLFIKIGVETLPPLSLVVLRLLVGFAILLVVVGVTRTPLPRDLRTLGHLAILGAVNIAIPFWLIAINSSSNCTVLPSIVCATALASTCNCGRAAANAPVSPDASARCNSAWNDGFTSMRL